MYFLFRKMPAQQLSLPEEMRIREHAHIRAVGNILLWKKNVRENICRYYENERGTYIFNSKDLCMIEHMDDILNRVSTALRLKDA